MVSRKIQCAVVAGVMCVPSLLVAQPPGGGGPQGGPRGGMHGEMHPGMRGGPPNEMIMQLFDHADADGDGSVTKEDLIKAMETMGPGGERSREAHGRDGQGRMEQGRMEQGRMRPGEYGAREHGPGRHGQGDFGPPHGERGPGGPPHGEHGFEGHGRQGGPGGPPPHEGGDGGHGPHGAPPEPGQIVPDPIANTLELSDKQQADLAALQADVDKRLAEIFTSEQMEQFKTAGPPQGHGPEAGQHREGGPREGGKRGGGGGRGSDRPDRPQRPQ
ncbi:MAG: EF-hand domain-containing protein [Rhodopirellula sp. JB044]|uniref:EF-hand domain-containing protein n=1 Tax=Rhodopirellula sp. JB044 TaxID=3342844 RepID=UPI00370AACE4